MEEKSHLNQEGIPGNSNLHDYPNVDDSTPPLPAVDQLDLEFLNDVDLDLLILNDLLRSPIEVGDPNSSILDQYHQVESPTSTLQFETPFQRSILFEPPAEIDSPPASTPTPKEAIPDSQIMVDSNGNPQPDFSKFPKIWEASLFQRPPAPQRAPSSTMTVVVRHDGKETKVGVRGDQPVSALRGRLRLPEPCLLVHRKRFIEENQSFEKNAVVDGDVIEFVPLAGYRCYTC